MTFIGIIIFHIHIQLEGITVWKMFIPFANNFKRFRIMGRGGEALPNGGSDGVMTPTTSTIQLCEPLLEISDDYSSLQ